MSAIRDKAQGFLFFEWEWNEEAESPWAAYTAPQRRLCDYLLARNALDRVVAVSFNCDFGNDDVFGEFRAQWLEIPPEGLAALDHLPNLRWLDFDLTTVTDEQLAALPALPKLESLRLQHCDYLTRRGFATLQRFSNLVNLDVSGTALEDGDLAVVASRSQLERLDLAFTKITDAGLPHLYSLKKLQHLNLKRTSVTPGGISELRRRLPNAAILIDFQTAN